MDMHISGFISTSKKTELLKVENHIKALVVTSMFYDWTAVSILCFVIGRPSLSST